MTRAEARKIDCIAIAGRGAAAWWLDSARSWRAISIANPSYRRVFAADAKRCLSAARIERRGAGRLP